MTTPHAPLLALGVELANAGIPLTLRLREGSMTLEFEDGFYKADGCTYLQQVHHNIVLFSRYDEKTAVLCWRDVVQESHRWYLFSKDRHEGWATPPAHWAKLYEELL